MSFTDLLEQENAERLAAIHAMPFNQEMADGTMPEETFRNYIIQDAYYLDGFARALALAAAKAPDSEAVAQLAGAATGVIMDERQLHDEYMVTYGVSRETFLATPPSQACDHYVNFLLSTSAIEPVPIAVAALLPCFSIYLDVGEAIQAKAPADHPYRAWIETYAGEEFATVVKDMKTLTNRLADKADDGVKNGMRSAYAHSAWHEWMFWHSAYHRQTWPLPASA